MGEDHYLNLVWYERENCRDYERQDEYEPESSCLNSALKSQKSEGRVNGAQAHSNHS